MADELYNSYSIEKTADEISGSLTIWEDEPNSPYDIGDTFSPVPGVTLNVKKVNISDNVIGKLNGKPFRQWQVVIEGSSEEQGDGGTNIKYNFSVSAEETSGSMEVTNKGSAPSLTLEIGDKFNVPGLGDVKCTSIKASNSYNENGVQTWNVTYEGVTSSANSSGSSGSTSDDETISYELNGVTVRTVAGEFLALRRSAAPIKKGSYTITNNSSTPLTTPGNKYNSETVISESITKESTKVNGVVTKISYKHTIETET